MSLRKDVLAAFEAIPAKERATLPQPQFEPDERQKARLIEFARGMDTADTIRHQSYEEFNHLSLMQVTNRDRKKFNNYIPAQSQDPDEAWKANTMRPVSRNKVISIAAHTTSSLLFPQVFAQNGNDDEDKDAALVMRDLTLWANEQSDYAEKFVKGTVKALVDPAMIMFEGYANVSRKVKEIQADGSWTEKTIVDDLYSGFQNTLIPVEELYITNIYESNIQKQPEIYWRRIITFDEAYAKYKDSPQWNYVQPGIKYFYAGDEDGFYELYDESISEGMVEEVIAFNRTADLQVPLINGMPMTDVDRPIQRDDKMYPFAKTGYEYFGGTDFFYYKSLVDKLSSDQKVIDTLYNIVLDASFLQVMPPSIVMGDDELSSSVVIPGGVTTLDENSKFQQVDMKSNLNAGLAVMQKVEASLSESSTAPLQAGQGSEGTPATAFEISRQEANAKTVLGLFGKMIVSWVEDFGLLRSNTILQHMTVAESVEIVGGETRLRFRNFLVPAGEEGQKAKKIEFALDVPEDEEEALAMSFDLLEQQAKKGVTISRVNPAAFRRRKYLFKVKADFMPAQSEVVKKALNLEAYDRAIKNPIADQTEVTKEFLFESYRPGESDRFIVKQPPAPQNGSQPNLAGNSNLTSQIINKAEAKNPV